MDGKHVELKAQGVTILIIKEITPCAFGCLQCRVSLQQVYIGVYVYIPPIKTKCPASYFPLASGLGIVRESVQGELYQSNRGTVNSGTLCILKTLSIKNVLITKQTKKIGEEYYK